MVEEAALAVPGVLRRAMTGSAVNLRDSPQRGGMTLCSL
jgi:hypothetical protein